MDPVESYLLSSGARGGVRTHMTRRSGGFKPPVSANSTTRAAAQDRGRAMAVRAIDCLKRRGVWSRSMSNEVTDRVTALVNAFDARVQAASSDSWANQSPCAEWKARDVVVHVSNNLLRIGGALTGNAGREIAADEDISSAWAEARDGFLSAMGSADLSQMVPGPFGPMPAEQLLGRIISADVLVHTWDLARAVGGDEQLDADAVAGAYSGLKPMDAMIRMPGVFGAKVDAPSGADLQAEFLSFLGRQV